MLSPFITSLHNHAKRNFYTKKIKLFLSIYFIFLPPLLFYEGALFIQPTKYLVHATLNTNYTSYTLPGGRHSGQG